MEDIFVIQKKKKNFGELILAVDRNGYISRELIFAVCKKNEIRVGRN